MKGLADRPAGYTVELLSGGATLDDVIDERICEQALAEKSAFMVGDLGALMRQHARWQSAAPRLQPYFPLRCNRSPAVVELLASLGLGFVCASKVEVSLALERGVPPDNIILSGVCKQLALVKAAAKHGVCHLVCENEAELAKIARLQPRAKLLLQLRTEAHTAETSVAFGASLKSCRHLLEAAKELGVLVVGVAFHVPTSCQDPQRAYSHALADARCVFDMGADLGFDMNILDVGGGFNGSEFQLKQVESALSPLLDTYFPPLSGVHVLAQPGSFYVASAFSLAVNVIAKEAVTRRWDGLAPGENGEDAEFLYYMNEGVYGLFGVKLLGNAIAVPAVHKRAPCADAAVYPSSLRGPTLDQLDLVVERCLLPELSVGDWLLFANMGACGLDDHAGGTCASPQPPVYYAAGASDWTRARMYQLPVTNLEKVRKARKAVKNVLGEIGLEDCQNFLKELDGKNVEKDTKEDSAEENPLMGTEWTDFTDGYNGRQRKKWPYRSRTMCCVMCKYSSKNIYHYRNHVARCHEYLQRLCSLSSCQRCVFVAHPRAVKRHILLFHGGRAQEPGAPPAAPAPAAPPPAAVVNRGIERYKCRKCSYPSHSVFAVKKHIILKHMESVAEQYIGYRHPIAGSNAKLYCCKVCNVNTGNLDQMLHHMLVEPKHYNVSTQVQTMIYDNKAAPAAAPRAVSTPNGNGVYVTLPNLAPKPMNNKPFVVPSNGQNGSSTVVALQQLQGASNSATLICAPASNQGFLPPQASALVQLASAEAKGLLQPGATISLRGSSVVQYPGVKPATPAVASPQAQQILIPAPKPAGAQIPPANQVTLQGTMLTSQSLLSHLIPTGNRVNGMPTYTFAPLQVAVPVTQSSIKPAEHTANQAKKWITCPLCNELFPSNVFDMHIEVAHQTKLAAARTESLAGRAAFLKKMPDKTIKCLTCKVLLSEKSVLQHLLHGLSCLYCSTLFFSVKQLSEHVKKHNPTGKLYCDFLRQNYKIYTKGNAGILFPYFDVTTEAPQEILGECEVNLALVTSSLELIYVKLQPSSQPEVCSAPVKVNASCCPFCDEKFQEEAKYLQHLKQKHLVAPTIHAILKTDAFKCIYCNGVYTGKVTQQAVMLHIQRCRCSPKPPQVPKIAVPAPPQVPKPAQTPRQPSGLYFLQVPQGVTVKPVQPKTAVQPKIPPQTKEQLESTRRLEAALKQVIEFNKREREQKAAVRRKEPPDPEISADPNIKLVLEPASQDRRGHEERRDFIARYFNVRPYVGRAETEELCRRLSLSKSELVALFSKKRIRCMKSFRSSKAAVLLGFDMARLARLQHPLAVPEQRSVESREAQLEELAEVPADAAEVPAAGEPDGARAGGTSENDKVAAEVPVEQNN